MFWPLRLGYPLVIPYTVPKDGSNLKPSIVQVLIFFVKAYKCNGKTWWHNKASLEIQNDWDLSAFTNIKLFIKKILNQNGPKPTQINGES